MPYKYHFLFIIKTDIIQYTLIYIIRYNEQHQDS
jgi:hypothetical protein